MLTIRKSGDRGYYDHGWLKTLHSFSFANYYDPRHMGFKSLRVINQDRIEGGAGFGAHPHKDMEIISYVVRGVLEHKDSMGNETQIYPGEVQRMSAGTGVVHSEYSISSEETEFFQIWILPDSVGGTPGYGQKSFEKEINSQKMVLVISHDGRDGSISIKQDADLYISKLHSGQDINFEVRSGRGVWIQLIKGRIQINDQVITAGDAASTTEPGNLQIVALDDSEFMIFDLI